MQAEREPICAEALSYAFQPIVDIANRLPYAYEALLRGAHNEPAGVILGPLDETAIEAIDQIARPRAIALAARLGLRTRLHLNFQRNRHRRAPRRRRRDVGGRKPLRLR